MILDKLATKDDINNLDHKIDSVNLSLNEKIDRVENNLNQSLNRQTWTLAIVVIDN